MELLPLISTMDRVFPRANFPKNSTDQQQYRVFVERPISAPLKSFSVPN